MLEEPICCELRIDTFLAVTDLEPREQKKFRRTLKEKKRIKEKLIRCLTEEENQDTDSF